MHFQKKGIPIAKRSHNCSRHSCPSLRYGRRSTVSLPGCWHGPWKWRRMVSIQPKGFTARTLGHQPCGSNVREVKWRMVGGRVLYSIHFPPKKFTVSTKQIAKFFFLWNICGALFRGCYWAMRYDGKARVECNQFDRWYNCQYICESCLSQRRTKNSDPTMWYCDFRKSAARHLTSIDDKLYRQTCKTLSPYACIPGWSLGTCLRDILHVVFLGTAKDLLPSILADWIDHGLLGGRMMSLDDRLRAFSLEMHQVFRKERTLEQQFISFSDFLFSTKRNLGS